MQWFSGSSARWSSSVLQCSSNSSRGPAVASSSPPIAGGGPTAAGRQQQRRVATDDSTRDPDTDTWAVSTSLQEIGYNKKRFKGV